MGDCTSQESGRLYVNIQKLAIIKMQDKDGLLNTRCVPSILNAATLIALLYLIALLRNVQLVQATNKPR